MKGTQIVGQYVTNFNVAYPQKQVVCKYNYAASRRNNEDHFDIIIDNEYGPRPLSATEMKEAAAMFLL